VNSPEGNVANLRRPEAATASPVSLYCYGTSPAEVVAIAQEAERAGYLGMWLGEHALRPERYESSHAYSAAGAADHVVVGQHIPAADLWVTLGAIAAVTTRPELGSGVYILPLRHPLGTATATATLQALCGGRFHLGVGSGWLAEEFDAFGLDFRTRGTRMNEIVKVLRMLWQGRPAAFEGRFFRFRLLEITDTPVTVPLVFGGKSPQAVRRAAQFGDG
jgi:probable F420-dependent oxidoreductase